MRQPPERRTVPADLVSALADLFLDWAQKNRASATYRWYQYRLALIVRRYPALRITDLKPFHVQQWIDSHDELSSGSRRNLARSIQRCLSWCEEQGLIDKDPIRRFRKPQGGQAHRGYFGGGICRDLGRHTQSGRCVIW
jgi:hypothetical protein